MKSIRQMNYRLVTTKPKIVLLVVLLVTLLAGYLSAGLNLELSWVSLAPKGHEAVQEYQNIMEDFPTLSNIIVLVEGGTEAERLQAIETLEVSLRDLEDYVVSTTSSVDEDFLLDYGMSLVDQEAMEATYYMFLDPNLQGFIQSYQMLLSSPEAMDMEEALLKSSEDLLDTMLAYSQGQGQAEDLRQVLVDFYTSSDQDQGQAMNLLMVQPSFDMMDIEMLSPGVNAIEERVDQVGDMYPNLSMGATGMHVVGRDETASIQSDSSLTTIIALVGIFALLYFAFRAVTAPLLTFAPLLLGIVWSIGLTSLLIGRLNMMTAFSAAMLMGLGIDYAIHLYSSYTERLAKGLTKEKAIEEAIHITGPSIITGALTTAIAFFTLNVSELELLKELGTVMGLGIITTLLAVFWVLPALLMLKTKPSKKQGKIKGTYKWIGNLASFVYKQKRLALLILVFAGAFMAYRAQGVEFDLNLMNLEPEGLESIELMNHMVEEYELSADSFSVEVDSIEEVYRLHKAYLEVDGVKEVASIATILPEPSLLENRYQSLQALDLAGHQVDLYGLDPEVLSQSFDHIMAGLAYLPAGQADQVMYQLALIQDRLREDPRAFDGLAEDFYTVNDSLGERLFTPRRLTVDLLPDNFKNQFVSEDGQKFLINIYPDFDIWSNMDTDKGEAFFKDIEEVSPSITGTPIFMDVLYESASSQLLMIGSLLGLILLVILLVHFRSIKYAVFALIPLGLTLIFTLGTMNLLDIKFNMLNFLAVLLIIGIGIDDGVHILHHYKQGDRDIHHLFSSVGRAILLTTVTTVCGFGSLAFSSYRGIASLGIVLSIGVIYAFFMTVLVLPILLKHKTT